MAPGTVAQPKAINQKKTGATHFQPGLLDLPAVTAILANPSGNAMLNSGQNTAAPTRHDSRSSFARDSQCFWA
jgi:hypothetical protein